MHFNSSKVKDMKDFEFPFKIEQTYCIKMVELFGHKWSEACGQKRVLSWENYYSGN